MIAFPNCLPRRITTLLLAGALAAPGVVLAQSAINRCEVNGKVVYSDVPCANSDSRTVDVHINSGFQRTEVPPPPLTTPSSNAPAQGAGTQLASPSSASDEMLKQQRCKLIKQSIAANEDAAREPQSGQSQDRLTKSRRQLIDEKEELGCP